MTDEIVPQTDVLRITNEQQFFEYANGVLMEGQEVQRIVFDGWPTTKFNVVGARYHSSLPAKMMEGLIDFQHEVEKTYAKLSYGVANRNKLTNADKDALEIVFKIKEGSTDAEGPNDSWFNKIWDKLDLIFEDMTGLQKTAILSVLVIAGTTMYVAPQVIDSNEKVALAELELEKEKVDADKDNLVVGALRDIVLAKSKEETPEQSKAILDHFDEGYKSVIRSVQDANKMEIGGTVYSNQEIIDISAKPDVVTDVEEVESEVHIDSIKKNSDYMLLGVTTTDGILTFNIKVDTSFLPDSEREWLHDSFRDGRKTTLKYQVKLKNGDISEARLISVKDLEEMAEIDSSDIQIEIPKVAKKQLE